MPLSCLCPRGCSRWLSLSASCVPGPVGDRGAAPAVPAAQVRAAGLEGLGPPPRLAAIRSSELQRGPWVGGAGPDKPRDPCHQRLQGLQAQLGTSGQERQLLSGRQVPSLTLPQPGVFWAPGLGEGRPPAVVSEGHSALRFGLWVGQEERSLGDECGSVGQQTTQVVALVGRGWTAAQWGPVAQAPRTALPEPISPGDPPSWTLISSGGKTTV